MPRFGSFLSGMIAGAALLHTAMNFHVVRSRDGIEFVAKQPARLSEAYIDIRSFGLRDWTSHPQLAAALVSGGKQHLVGESAAGAIQDSVNQLLPNWPTE